MEKKYLYYKFGRMHTHNGISHKRASLSVLLAESMLYSRIAVLPKFTLSSNFQNTDEKHVFSHLIEDYFNMDEINYIFEHEFLENNKCDNATIITDNQIMNNEPQIIIRQCTDDDFFNLHKLTNVIDLAGRLHGVGMKMVIPKFTPTDFIRTKGNLILNCLSRPIIGIHLRRGDKLNNKFLKQATTPNKLVEKCSVLDYSSVYYCTNDINYKINEDKWHDSSHFKNILEDIKDNYMLFCIEMYIVDNCDISIRTFNDSSIFFHKQQIGTNYYITPQSMHKHKMNIEVPTQLISQNYEK